MIKKSITEAQKSTTFISQGKQATYKNGGSRYDTRKDTSLNSAGTGWVEQDVNMLFKTGNYLFSIPVHGKTNDYTVTIKILHFLDRLNDLLKTKQFAVPTFQQALMNSMNTDDVQCSCNCLEGSVKIKLLDGRDVPISQLVKEFNQGKENYIYSTDDNGDFVPSKIAWVGQTGLATELLEVVLDNGEKVLTTFDHLYRKRTGEYIPASELQPGDSLMPLYFREGIKGYTLVKDNSTNYWYSVYKRVAKHYFPEQFIGAEERAKLDGSIEKVHYGAAVHHRDFVKENNYPDNLQIMTAMEHWMYHAKCAKKPLWENMSEEGKAHLMAHGNAMNANPTPRMLEVRKKFIAAGVATNYDPERKVRQAALMSKVAFANWAALTPEQRSAQAMKSKATAKARGTDHGWHLSEETKRKHSEASKLSNARPEVRQKIREGIANFLANETSEERAARLMKLKEACNRPEAKLARARTCSKKVFLKLIADKLPLTEENYETVRKSVRFAPKLSSVFPEGISQAVSFFELNHKVVSVRKVILSEPVPVYDLTTEESTHNFLLSAGVIVHNCPDQIYRWQHQATLNDNNSGRPETRPSLVTNPTNKPGSCKHILFVLSNKIWATKVARTLFNYIIDIWKNKKQLFDRIIRPALNDITDEKILGQPEKVEQPITQIPPEDIATEAINSYYQGSQQFDDDQEFALQICAELGADVRIYVTPENTPEQIEELGEMLKLGVEPNLIRELSDPSISYKVINLIGTASLQGINLLPYKDFPPDALEQILRGVQLKVPIDKIALRGFNARQIEQLVRAYRISPQLYKEICDPRITYNGMRDIIRQKGN